MLIVDSHVHSVVGNPDYHYPLDFTLDDLLAAMDRAGVAAATPIQSKSGNGLDSDYPTLAINAHAQRRRLAPICGIDPRAANAPETLRHRIGVWGAKGARVFCSGWLQDAPEYQGFWEAAAELAVPITLTGPMQFERVAATARRSPELRLVIDHVGHADFTNGVPQDLLELGQFANIAIKFSSFVLDEAEKAGLAENTLFDQLFEAFGAERLMWGSNYPSSHEPRWPYSATVEAAKRVAARYHPAQQAFMLGGTALRHWPDLAP